MRLVPIKQSVEENKEFLNEPGCTDIINMTISYYKKIGFYPPWIGYLAKIHGNLVGSAGFKGRPVNNKIEIAYGTFPDFRMQGFGTEICKQLVNVALKADPTLIITARTLPENNFSTKILEKNGFKLSGTIWDEEDGNVWEWIYSP